MDSGADATRLAAGLVLSDRAARGEYEDRSGPVLRRFLETWGFRLATVAVEADDPQRLLARLEEWRAAGAALVLTSGGTGIGPRDRTPETLRAWADRDVPGFGEWMRAESARHTVTGWLSRGGAWLKDRMLVVALPGSPKALEELLPGLEPIVRHALSMLEGQGH